MRTAQRIGVSVVGIRLSRPALVLAFSLCLLAACALPVRAEWQTFGVGDGLAHSSVQAILEDSSGSLWFATGVGVSRYDGVSWTTYTTEDGLARDSVRAILEDSFGDLWFGTQEGGVSRYDGVSWTTYSTEDGLASDTVYAIIEDSSGNLWFATWGGVSVYDGLSWTTYTTDDGLASNGVYAIIEDNSGTLWFGTYQDGVSSYDGVGWTTYTTEDGLADNHVLAIAEDSSGDLWFGTWDGVSRYDGVSWTTYTAEDGLAGGAGAILEDRFGGLWFGTGAGASLFDGVSWTTYTTEDGLVSNSVLAVQEDPSGNLWFGTNRGVSRYDGESWTTYTTEDGLAHNSVNTVLAGSSGDLWFATWGSGVSRYDGVSWTTYTIEDGLAGNAVRAIIEGSSGDLWFGTMNGGVSRYDGVSWTTFTTDDGLAGNSVYTILEDSSGDLWFGTWGGVSVYDGVSWTTYTTEDGLGDNYVRAISEDCSGNLWFGTRVGGVSRYDGVSWTTFTTDDGLAGNSVGAILEDSSGDLWFGAGEGASRREPDRVAPQTVIRPKPPSLIPGRVQQIAFAAAHGESWQVLFSHAVDGSSWSDWTPVGSWVGSGLTDGEHIFTVRAKDAARNIDATPAVVAFEVDATPPAGVIASPAFGEAVRDSVSILGTAADPRFLEYELEVRAGDSAVWDALAASSSPVTEGVLGGWNTMRVPDGDCELRLSAMDTLGLTGSYLVRVVVDNEAPWASETTPAVVSASSGGDVYTTNQEVHLYFPPHAFAEAAVVTVEPAEGVVPDTLVGGAELAAAGYDISWEGGILAKPATLEMSVMGTDDRESGAVMSLYVLTEGEDWQRLGGTVSGDGSTLSAAIEDEGTYAVYTDSGEGTGDGLTALSFSPRVFSPSGGFATDEVAIGFSLGRAGPVTVKIYNRAGRLVRELAAGLGMNAGANLLRWDGRGSDGSDVPDGLYLVTVEALGETQTSTLAVVR